MAVVRRLDGDDTRTYLVHIQVVWKDGNPDFAPKDQTMPETMGNFTLHLQRQREANGNDSWASVQEGVVKLTADAPSTVIGFLMAQWAREHHTEIDGDYWRLEEPD